MILKLVTNYQIHLLTYIMYTINLRKCNTLLLKKSQRYSVKKTNKLLYLKTLSSYLYC